MTNQLREMIVLGILSCGIGYLACKGNVLSDMASNVYPALYVCIIILPSLVLPIQSLLHSSFQECWKQVNEEIEDAFLVRIELQVEKINGKHLSQHIVQEIVIIPLCEPRTDTHFSIATTNEAHDVACHHLLAFHLKDMGIAYLIPIDI